MKCRESSCYPGAERGSALVLAIAVVALVTALAVRFSGEFMVTASQVENRLVLSRYQRYLEGAEALAAVVLEQDGLDGDFDHPGEAWARDLPPLAIEGGQLRMNLMDAQARINLNSLGESTQWINDVGASPAIRFTAMQRHFIRLLQTFEEHPMTEYEAVAVLEAVIDWMDQNDTPTGAGGAESVYYGGEEPPYGSANVPFRSLSELRLVRHLTPALYRLLEPHLVVLPAPTPLNVNTVQATLLRTFNVSDDLVPLEPARVEALLAVRREQPFPSREAFLEDAFARDMELDEEPGVYSVGSEYFLLRGEIVDGALYTASHSLLHRHVNGVETIRRSYSDL